MMDLTSPIRFLAGGPYERHTPSARERNPHYVSGTIAFISLVVVLGSTTAFGAVDDEDCGTLANAFGPFDYRTAGRDKIEIVESHHFTPKVENLVAGQEGRLEGDISYTLRAFPNHHRALLSMARLMLRERKTKLPSSPYSIDCWFKRAMQFQEDDGQVHAIYGYYLSRVGKLKESAQAFRDAIELGLDSANVHYNLGLVLLDLKDYDGALVHAKKAYELGFQLPGLRNKLREAGRWTD
jgi:tetratricopeptide (TPR) repeat protein